MKKKPKISRVERLEISILLQKGYGIREMGRVLDRSPSSILEEIKKNKVNGVYHPKKAHHKSYIRRKYAKYQGKKINENDKLREYIIDKLERSWNPEVISGRIKKENLGFYASKTSIYEWLRSIYGTRYCHLLHAKRYYVKRRKTKKNRRVMIPYRKDISLRPRITGFAHYEVDTVISGKRHKSKVSLSVIYNINSKYVDMRKINNLKPVTFNQAILSMKQRVKKIRTLTLDNGIENKHHYQLGLDTYFCRPYHSFEKGGVENVNGLIRRYIKKGSDISKYSSQYIKQVVDILNNKPRKSLDYQTPYEVMIKYNQLSLNKQKTPSLGVRIEG